MASSPPRDELEIHFRDAAHGRQALLRERLAEYGPALDQAAILGRKRVESRCNERVQGVRHLEIAETAPVAR